MPCANASTSAAGARAVEECFCEPGFWRGCTRTKDRAEHDAGFVNASGQPCVLDFEQPCVQCGPHDVCVNDTLLHCPDNSLAPMQETLYALGTRRIANSSCCGNRAFRKFCPQRGEAR